MRCVIADDSSIMRGRLTGYLRLSGHEVVGQASNANEALELCKKEKPDLAVLDIMMPPGDGKTTALLLMAEKIVPYILVCSSNSQGALMDTLVPHGIFTIKKPITQEKFDRKIRAMMT